MRSGLELGAARPAPGPCPHARPVIPRRPSPSAPRGTRAGVQLGAPQAPRDRGELVAARDRLRHRPRALDQAPGREHQRERRLEVAARAVREREHLLARARRRRRGRRSARRDRTSGTPRARARVRRRASAACRGTPRPHRARGRTCRGGTRASPARARPALGRATRSRPSAPLSSTGRSAPPAPRPDPTRRPRTARRRGPGSRATAWTARLLAEQGYRPVEEAELARRSPRPYARPPPPRAAHRPGRRGRAVGAPISRARRQAVSRWSPTCASASGSVAPRREPLRLPLVQRARADLASDAYAASRTARGGSAAPGRRRHEQVAPASRSRRPRARRG